MENLRVTRAWLDPTSTQKWTRCRPLFISHEATARGMQYVREDFGPLPIHQHRQPKKPKGAAFAAKKLADTNSALASMLGPSVEWD